MHLTNTRQKNYDYIRKLKKNKKTLFELRYIENTRIIIINKLYGLAAMIYKNQLDV